MTCCSSAAHEMRRPGRAKIEGFESLTFDCSGQPKGLAAGASRPETDSAPLADLARPMTTTLLRQAGACSPARAMTATARGAETSALTFVARPEAERLGIRLMRVFDITISHLDGLGRALTG